MYPNKFSIRNIIGFSLTLLLVIQLFALPTIPSLAKSSYEIYAHYVYAYLIFSYFAFTAILFLEIKNLQELHIDQLTLQLLILSCFIRGTLGISNDTYYLLPIMLFGVANIVIVIKNRSAIPRTNKKGVVVGIIIGFIVLAITTVIESFQASKWITPVYATNIVINFVRQLIFQLSFVVLIEEIVFRGFLAGYLVKIGLQENTAIVIQALLFWLTHYAQIGNFITFFVTIPFLTVSTSIITKRYKQVFPAIIIHTLINTLMPLIITLWLNINI